MVNIGDTAHDEERDWVNVKLGLAHLDEVSDIPKWKNHPKNAIFPT